MKRLLPGLITAIVGGLLLRETYARGFNKGVAECKKVVNLTMDLTDIIQKENENRKMKDLKKMMEEEAH